MCVRRGTRAVCIAVLVSSAVFLGGPSRAQSLTQALSGPAGNAMRSASVGSWATVTRPNQPKPAANAFDHWQAKIILAKPSFPRTNKGSKTGAMAQMPFALHGPLAEGTRALIHGMKGLASFYGSGERTATGETFDPNGLTAAHRTLPFGTRVRVTRVDTGDSVVVRINDRGPFKPGRVIDLSRKAAEDLNMTDKGLTAVKLEVVDGDPVPVAENVAQRSLGR
jgi:rare lipoprotein A